MHEHDVTEVDVGFPGVQRLLPHLGQADHGLQLSAVPLLQRREAQLAGVAGEHHAAGDADDLPGLGVGRQLGVRGAQLGQGVGTRHLHGIRFTAFGEQPLPLALTDPELLGDVGLELGRLVTVGWGHEMPAYVLRRA